MVASFDATAVVHGDLLHDGQSKAASTTAGASPGGIPPVEALKHAAEIGLTQARAVITDAEQPPAAALPHGHIDAALIRGVTQGIVEKVEHSAMQTTLIPEQRS
jgi:hypothetical protein